MASQVRQQIEYYLSDNNLSKDLFFRDLILREGALKLETLLNCNKLKALKCTPTSMLEAIEGSDLVEATEDKASIKRKQPLSEVPIVKKVKTESEQAVDEIKSLNPMVLTLKGADSEVNWRDLQAAFTETFGLRTFYFRFKEGNGHVVIDRSKAGNIDTLSQGYELQGNKYEVKVAEGAELKEFYAQHGEHYNMCLKFLQKNKQDLVNQERQKGIKQTFFMGKKYSNITQLKTVFKNIITRTINGDRIKEPYNNMLKEILKHHANGDKKVENMDYFTVGEHPNHPDSRCFFVVKKDETKEDFSVIKCIENLVNKN